MSITITTSIVTIVGISIGFSFTALATSSLNGPRHEGSCTTRVSSYSTAMETMIEAVITIAGIGISCGLSFTLLAAIHRTASEAGGFESKTPNTRPAWVALVESWVMMAIVDDSSISISLRLSEGHGDQNQGNQKLVHFEIDHYPLGFSAVVVPM